MLRTGRDPGQGEAVRLHPQLHGVRHPRSERRHPGPVLLYAQGPPDGGRGGPERQPLLPDAGPDLPAGTRDRRLSHRRPQGYGQHRGGLLLHERFHGRVPSPPGLCGPALGQPGAGRPARQHRPDLASDGGGLPPHHQLGDGRPVQSGQPQPAGDVPLERGQVHLDRRHPVSDAVSPGGADPFHRSGLGFLHGAVQAPDHLRHRQERRVQQIRNDSGGVCGRRIQERRFPGQGGRQLLLQHAALAGSGHHDRGRGDEGTVFRLRPYRASWRSPASI